jgi:long-chain acyl-CoA synthetase
MRVAQDENIARALLHAEQRDPDAPALRSGTEVITHGELDAAILTASALLASHGVAPGDRVGLIVPNVPQFAVIYYAVLAAGAVAVPISPLLSAPEARFCLNDAGARLALLAPDAHGPGLAELKPSAQVLEVGTESLGPLGPGERLDVEVLPRAGEDTAVIIYTSGTTGRPKGARLTHRNLASNADAILEAAGISAATVALGALPLSHSFGQTWLLNATLRAGGSVSLLASFDARRALEKIAEHQVTFFAGVPTMFAKMLEVQKQTDASSLQLCVSGGAAMPHELMNAFEANFGCEIREGYGLSETSPLVTLNPPGAARRPGSVGPPIPGVEVKAVADDDAELDAGEVGEILVRGHNVMKGYWGRPHETARAITEDGWFRTGDVGYVDLDGYLYISGRKKDLIIRGGYNVYPREVEEALLEHPDVAEAAVIGIPHPTLGEEVAAAVRLQEGADCTAEDLRRHARERLAAFKYPRRIWTVDALPTGPTGKVLKRLIEVPAEPIHAVSNPVPQGDRRNQ